MHYVIISFELTDVVSLEELNVNIKIKIRNEKNKTRNKSKLSSIELSNSDFEINSEKFLSFFISTNSAFSFSTSCSIWERNMN